MNTIIRVRLCIGLAVLLLGTLVYILDRPPEQTLLVEAVGLPSVTAGIFGAIGGVLPAFAHVFAFIVFTVVLLGYSRSVLIGACAGWFLIDAAFELGQHPQIASWLSAHLSAGPESSASIGYIGNYFAYGTFDPWDLVAITMGTVVAYLVLQKTERQEFYYE